MVEAGRLGLKAGRGWYRYEGGSRTPIPDPEVELVLRECSRALGIDRRGIDAEEVVERTVYAMINEAARVLEEGRARRAADIDVLLVRGYGFPPHRGGPMWYADSVGLARVSSRIAYYEKNLGTRQTVAPLLKRLAEQGSDVP